MPADPFSAWSHALGAVIFAMLSISLIRRAKRHGTHAFAFAVFALSAIALLCASTLFHIFPHGTPAGDTARRADHAAIFILIAGTFTPIHMTLFRGVLRWGILFLIWTCAAVGIAFKLAFFDVIPDWLHTAAYIVMGWIGAIGGTFAIMRRGVRYMAPVLVAAVAYTLGAIFELYNWPTLAPGLGPHEVFHIAVLIGLGAFWVFIHRLAGGVDEPITLRPVVGVIAPPHEAETAA